jgi:hypothetical protein
LNCKCMIILLPKQEYKKALLLIEKYSKKKT